MISVEKLHEGHKTAKVRVCTQPKERKTSILCTHHKVSTVSHWIKFHFIAHLKILLKGCVQISQLDIFFYLRRSLLNHGGRSGFIGVVQESSGKNSKEVTHQEGLSQLIQVSKAGSCMNKYSKRPDHHKFKIKKTVPKKRTVPTKT